MTTTDSIARAFITSDMELINILDAKKDSSPIHEAMTLLGQCIKGNQSANGAFLAAKNVDINSYDADICILFLASWAHACYMQSAIIQEKLPEAWTLLHRARSLVSESTMPEIQSYISSVESFLVAYEGNHEKQEEILSESLRMLDKSSPRRKHVLLDLATNLATCGRLKDLSSEINSLSSFSGNFKKSWITAIQFIDLIETGNITQASRLVPELSRAELDTPPLRDFQKYHMLMDVISSPSASNSETDDHVITSGDAPDWAMSLRCLLANKVHQSLRWARMCEKRNQLYTTAREFIAFNLLRAELAESNTEAARRIMDLRHKNGNYHYLDNYFLARISLQEGDEDSAAGYFATALESCEHYNALGRFDFELRISTDMSRDTLFRLANKASRMRESKAALSFPNRNELTPAKQPDGNNLTAIDQIIHSTPLMDKIMDSINNFAQVDVPVLITGETGTGKELAARALHEAGPRAKHAFVAINCGAISESLLESELFGHAKGAFSGAAAPHQGLFEEAANGTIFLDEIGEISPRLQVALLRVLETSEIRPVGSSQSQKIKCRVIASTNADLEKLEKENQFRRDLIFRLRRLEIHMPALSERVDDILLLTAHFLNSGRPKDVYATISSGLASKLISHNWPGNVRELRNSVERMRLMNSDKLYYEANDLELNINANTSDFEPSVVTTEPASQHRLPVSQQRSPLQKRGTFVSGRSRVRRLANIQTLFKAHRILTRNEIVQSMEISPNTATADLKELCADGFIKKVQPTASPRSTYWELND